MSRIFLGALRCPDGPVLKPGRVGAIVQDKARIEDVVEHPLGMERPVLAEKTFGSPL
jgi:hypothetical protein